MGADMLRGLCRPWLLARRCLLCAAPCPCPVVGDSSASQCTCISPAAHRSGGPGAFWGYRVQAARVPSTADTHRLPLLCVCVATALPAGLLSAQYSDCSPWPTQIADGLFPTKIAEDVLGFYRGLSAATRGDVFFPTSPSPSSHPRTFALARLNLSRMLMTGKSNRFEIPIRTR